jgi:hypothetical protein
MDSNSRAGMTGQALVCIEDPDVIFKILTFLKNKGAHNESDPLSDNRGPPITYIIFVHILR